MDPRRNITWTLVGLALTLALSGCSDFSQHRVGGVRKTDDVPPQPGQALKIPNAPSVAHADFIAPDEGVKQAKFEPKAAPAPMQVDPNLNPELPPQPMRMLYVRAAQRVAEMDSYIFRLKRREVVQGKKQPEEVLQVKVRREPFSVYLKWLSAEGKGRETVYVRGRYENKMQLVLAANDAFPFSPAGMRFSISPDDPLARAKSRYPITETGFASLIDRFGQLVASVERGDQRGGTAKYLPRLKRPEFETPVDAVHQILPPGSDPHMPKGGERWWYFDTATGLPALVIAHAPSGEVEYYCYDHVQWPVHLDEDDFNPDRLWRK